MSSYDAVVVGAGHNGLVAATILADAGWSVLVAERNEAPGGAVRTEEVTLPGYRHDLFAANLNLFAGSRFHEEYGERLAAHGLRFAAAPKPFASVFPDGTHLGVTTDGDETRHRLGELSVADAAAWDSLSQRFGEIAPQLFPLLGVPLPSAAAVAALARGARALGLGWLPELTRLVLQSTREFTTEHFEREETRSLIGAWGMHLDFPPDVSGGALFPFLETFASAANGMVIGQGGATTMIDALVSLFEAAGGTMRTAAPVERISVQDAAATSVVLEDGEVITARKAVIANLTPPVLERLLEDGVLPDPYRAKVSRYRYGPGTMVVHLAMDDLPGWVAGEEVREFSYVHIGPYLDDMSLAYQQAVAGHLPKRPTLVVGQPTAVDPSRAPEGKHVLWVQVRVLPAVIEGDAAGEIEATGWDDAKEAYADRVLAIIEEYAPGVTTLVRARHVLSPADLERANPNLGGGDSLGGSHHLMQHFFLRPFPGWTRYETPVERLYICGAATWPGAGVGAGSGYLLGKKLTKPTLFERLRS